MYNISALMRDPYLKLHLGQTWGKAGFMKFWQCVVCGFIYDEAAGLPDEGIEPGTAWEDIPNNWKCPECGVAKSDFEMIQI